MFGIVSTGVLTLNEAIENTIVVSIEQRKAKNLVLKTTIEMLENALNLDPLLMTLITIWTQEYTIPISNTSHGSIRD